MERVKRKYFERKYIQIFDSFKKQKTRNSFGNQHKNQNKCSVAVALLNILAAFRNTKPMNQFSIPYGNISIPQNLKKKQIKLKTTIQLII